MSRPHKKGLDYFPLDTSFSDNVKLLKADEGPEGLSILIELWQKIYDIGYYCNWTRNNAKLFSTERSYDFQKVNDVVESCFENDLFNREKWDEFGILTSKEIQRRYIQATRRRSSVELIDEYCLLNNPENEYKNVSLTGVIDSNNLDNDEENGGSYEQSKVKESKVKESTNNVEETSTDFSEEYLIEEYGELALKATQHLIEQIKEHHPKSKMPEVGEKRMDRWVKEMDRLNRIGFPNADEGFTWQEIRNMIDWVYSEQSKNGDFWWAEVIKSSGKFREQTEKFWKRALNDNGGNKDYEKMAEERDDGLNAQDLKTLAEGS